MLKTISDLLIKAQINIFTFYTPQGKKHRVEIRRTFADRPRAYWLKPGRASYRRLYNVLQTHPRASVTAYEHITPYTINHQWEIQQEPTRY